MDNMKKIPIGGANRPIHFGFAALADWCKLTGLGLQDLNTIGANMGLQDAIYLAFSGLKHGARRAKKEFNYTIDDVADWIDDEGMDIFTEIMEHFSESMTKITPDSEKKKKEVQKTK